MKKLESMLQANSRISDYKINSHEIKSYEMFFVKGKLETVRRTNTCDTRVTVYVSHGEFLGDAEFLVYLRQVHYRPLPRMGKIRASRSRHRRAAVIFFKKGIDKYT